MTMGSKTRTAADAAGHRGSPTAPAGDGSVPGGARDVGGSGLDAYSSVFEVIIALRKLAKGDDAAGNSENADEKPSTCCGMRSR